MVIVGTSNYVTGRFTNAVGANLNLTSNDVTGHAWLTDTNILTNKGNITLTNNSVDGYYPYVDFWQRDAG